MENIVRTVYGANLQTCQLLGLPITQVAHTTLNEKYSIQTNVQLPNTAMPTMKYVGVGNGGHTMTIGANNTPVVQSLQHRPSDASLFNQLPLVLRLPSNDLTPVQAAKYRLKTSLTINGVSYIAYYLKVLDFSNTLPTMTYNAVANGVTTTTPFVPTNGNLNPTPPSTTSTGSVSTTGDYISATAVVPFTMSANDIAELINVSEIMYGSPDLAIISEIALCSGVDMVVSGSFNGATASYTESIDTQIINFINAFLIASYSGAINMSLDVGSVEPLLALS